MNRRGFLSAMCATLVAPDPEQLLWRPGARLISVPSGHKLIEAKDWMIWYEIRKNPTELERYSGHGIWSWPWPNGYPYTSQEIHTRAQQELAKLDKRYKYASWIARNGKEVVRGEIFRNA